MFSLVERRGKGKRPKDCENIQFLGFPGAEKKYFLIHEWFKETAEMSRKYRMVFAVWLGVNQIFIGFPKRLEREAKLVDWKCSSQASRRKASTGQYEERANLPSQQAHSLPSGTL